MGRSFMTSRRRSAATQNEAADFIRLGATMGANTVAQQAQAVAAYREQRLQNEGMLMKLRLEQANKDREALFKSKQDILKSNLDAMGEVMKNPENYDPQTLDTMRYDYQNTLAAMDNLTKAYTSGNSIADMPVIASTFNYPVSGEVRSRRTAENTILQNRSAIGDLGVMSAYKTYNESGGLFSDPGDFALNNYRGQRLDQFDTKLQQDAAYKQEMLGRRGGGAGAGKYAQNYRKLNYLSGNPDMLPGDLAKDEAAVAALYPEMVQMAAEQNPAFGDIIQNRVPGIQFDPTVRGFKTTKDQLDAYIMGGVGGILNIPYTSPKAKTAMELRDLLYPQ